MVLLTADTWVREDPGSSGKETPGAFAFFAGRGKPLKIG